MRERFFEHWGAGRREYVLDRLGGALAAVGECRIRVRKWLDSLRGGLPAPCPADYLLRRREVPDRARELLELMSLFEEGQALHGDARLFVRRVRDALRKFSAAPWYRPLLGYERWCALARLLRDPLPARWCRETIAAITRRVESFADSLQELQEPVPYFDPLRHFRFEERYRRLLSLFMRMPALDSTAAGGLPERLRVMIARSRARLFPHDFPPAGGGGSASPPGCCRLVALFYESLFSGASGTMDDFPLLGAEEAWKRFAALTGWRGSKQLSGPRTNQKDTE